MPINPCLNKPKQMVTGNRQGLTKKTKNSHSP